MFLDDVSVKAIVGFLNLNINFDGHKQFITFHAGHEVNHCFSGGVM